VSLFANAVRLQLKVSATSDLSACCAASGNTPPQSGWRRQLGRCCISWLHTKSVPISTCRPQTLRTMPSIGSHGEQSQRLPGYNNNNNNNNNNHDDIYSAVIYGTSHMREFTAVHLGYVRHDDDDEYPLSGFHN